MLVEEAIKMCPQIHHFCCGNNSLHGIQKLDKCTETHSPNEPVAPSLI